jgi:hypothetical protein
LHPAANHNAIVAAVAFHRSIGGDRKVSDEAGPDEGGLIGFPSGSMGSLVQFD